MIETITVESLNEGTLGVVRVNGYLNQTGGEEIHKACTRLVADGAQGVLIDLAQCTIINSVGMSCLIEVLEQCTAQDCRLAFCQAAPTIGKTLRIMGFLKRATLHETETEAVHALGGTGG